MTTNDDSQKTIIGCILEAMAYRYEELTPGEPIDDATDLLQPGDDEDPILDSLRKALWSLEDFDINEAADFLTEISAQIPRS